MYDDVQFTENIFPSRRLSALSEFLRSESGAGDVMRQAFESRLSDKDSAAGMISQAGICRQSRSITVTPFTTFTVSV